MRHGDGGLARGRALDAFTYAGGFALQIAEVCGSVEADGKSIALWATDADGWLAMDAAASLD